MHWRHSELLARRYVVALNPGPYRLVKALTKRIGTDRVNDHAQATIDVVRIALPLADDGVCAGGGHEASFSGKQM